MLDGSSGQALVAYLIIRDSISQFFDESVQDVGMVDVLEEFHKPMLFCQRFELYDNSSQLPAKGLETCLRFLKRAVQTF